MVEYYYLGRVMNKKFKQWLRNRMTIERRIYNRTGDYSSSYFVAWKDLYLGFNNINKKHWS